MRWPLIISLSLLSSFALAQVATPPKYIFGLYSKRVSVCFNGPADSPLKFECEGETADWLLVVPAAGNRVWVQTSLAFHNGHSCSFEGGGEWKGNHVSVEKFDAEACELKLYFKNGRVSFSEDGRCRLFTCGARGAYDGLSLPKKGSM